MRSLTEERIDTAPPPADAGEHLMRGDGVTIGETWKPIFVYDHDIDAALSTSDANGFQGSLSSTVEGIIERASGA